MSGHAFGFPPKDIRSSATAASLKPEAAKLEGEGFIVGDYVNYGARHLLAKEPLTRPGGVGYSLSGGMELGILGRGQRFDHHNKSL